ncbi:peptidylprolyl isomerase [Paenibacillus xerothermodurans]|uniref:Peptidylprolyl isomerase n=1 Tax=Paenibacillus xerothermodurans TaxID=1977292 RepID=A0A2W1N4B9_PAEXE|nr:peptidylprolyl isomerase [Paenibacillus xerothermodurans]PZE19207.1 peptidylprolyl isomerase [Paenibacillus xerothermodurans]
MLSNKWIKTKKGLIVMLAAIALTVTATGCGKKDADPAAGNAAATQPAATNADEVLVTYKDGGQVTRGEFDTFVNINTFFYQQYAQYKDDPAFQQDMMKQLVTFRVLSSRADDKVKAEAEARAQEQMNQIKEFLNLQEGGMETRLKEANLTEKDIHDFVLRSMQGIGAMESKVTDEQVKAAYDQRLAQDKNAYDTATVSHILIQTSDPASGKETRSKEDAMKRAKEVQDKLKAGGDFAALAKEYSEDPGSKDNGGKYENAEVSKWVPEFKKAALELPINQISDPVETSYGYHVMKVESRSTKTFDEVKGDLRSEAAEPLVYEFVEQELPGLIETNKLPQPPATPPAAPGATPPANAPTTDAPTTDAPTKEAPPAVAPPAEAPKTEAPAQQ